MANPTHYRHRIIGQYLVYMEAFIGRYPESGEVLDWISIPDFCTLTYFQTLNQQHHCLDKVLKQQSKDKTETYKFCESWAKICRQ